MLIGEHGLTLGRAMNCMKLVKRKEFMEEDCIEAAKNNQHYDQCLNYLNHECLSCFFSYPVHKVGCFTYTESVNPGMWQTD